MRDAGADLDLWHWYERIRAACCWCAAPIPTMLTENACAMAARGPRAERYTVAGTGHFPMLVKQDEINAVKHFLG